ncbi:MAG: hypothetical protein GMKNLPBB_03322 [Myxococcota bacterium]|nr:hypothetical protein [Myxococcota bacterium]
MASGTGDRPVSGAGKSQDGTPSPNPSPPKPSDAGPRGIKFPNSDSAVLPPSVAAIDRHASQAKTIPSTTGQLVPKCCDRCGQELRSIQRDGNATGAHVCISCHPTDGICPSCHGELRTRLAQQCPHCRSSWRTPVLVPQAAAIPEHARPTSARKIVIGCPSCYRGFGVDENQLGTTADCPHCSRSFRVPDRKTWDLHVARSREYHWLLLDIELHRKAEFGGIEAIATAFRNGQILPSDLCVRHPYCAVVPVAQACDIDPLRYQLSPERFLSFRASRVIAVIIGILGTGVAIYMAWPMLTGRFFGELALALLAMTSVIASAGQKDGLAGGAIAALVIVWAGWQFFAINVAFATLKLIVTGLAIASNFLLAFGVAYAIIFLACVVIGTKRLRNWHWPYRLTLAVEEWGRNLIREL